MGLWRRRNVRPRPLTIILLAVVFGFDGTISTDAADHPVVARRPRKTPAVPISVLIRNLGHDRYAIRRKATVELGTRGKAAIPALVKAARNGSLETSARAIQVLEFIYSDLQADDATVAAAEYALELVKRSQKAAVSQLAEQVFARHENLREKRAIAAIRRLGGIVKYLPARNNNFGNNPFGNGQPPINFIVLGSKWKGGDKGLKYLSRLPDLRNLYVCRNKKFSPVTQKGLQKFQRESPNVSVEERGLSCLGVSGSPNGINTIGCYISGVEKGSAAANAKLRAGDIINRFAGKKVQSFQKLVSLIAEHNPGETVTVRIMRDGQLISAKVTLKEWSK